MTKLPKILTVTTALLAMQVAIAAASPQEQRHELMEGVGKAAKTIGGMLQGETAFDAAAAISALQTWDKASGTFGELFPAGSESGYDTEAKANIWTDREGFNAALNDWAEAVDAAVAANPQDLESLNAAAGGVFKKCKACHEEYRVEKD